MRYDFDSITDRRNTGSIKWLCGEEELPMWVADMDFKTAPQIIDAFNERISHGIYGYCDVTEDWANSYVSWWKRRHNVNFTKEDIIFSTGVIPSLSSCVRKLTTPDENVVVITPVYNIFFNCIRNNGRNIIEVPLIESERSFDIDYELLEKALANPQTSLLIFCNPQNPIGKIWSMDQISNIAKMALENNVIVISDEIHCDITAPSRRYNSFMRLSKGYRDNLVTLISPTKAFNIAGIQTSAVVITNPVLRHKVWRALNTDEVAEPNILAAIAPIVAFGEGEEWLEQMCEYVFDNRKEVIEKLSRTDIGIRVVSEDATYLLWLDIRDMGISSEAFCKRLRELTGLWISEGTHYGSSGEGFVRMNIACPRQVCVDGIKRLIDGVRKMKQ